MSLQFKVSHILILFTRLSCTWLCFYYRSFSHFSYGSILRYGRFQYLCAVLRNSHVGIKEPFKIHLDLFLLVVFKISFKQIDTDLLKTWNPPKINFHKSQLSFSNWCIYQSLAFQYAIRRWLLIPQYYKESSVLATLPPFQILSYVPDLFGLFPSLLVIAPHPMYFAFEDLDLWSPQSWKKYFAKSKEIQQNWTRLENFDICFLRNFDHYYRKFIPGEKHWALTYFLIQFGDFPIMS